MKILILSDLLNGVSKNTIYEIKNIKYTDFDGKICDKEKAEFEVFYYTNNLGRETYDYRNIETKECSADGNIFEVFETDFECAKWLIEYYKLNVSVIEK